MTDWTRTAIEQGVVLREGDSWIRVRPRVDVLVGARALVDAAIATADVPSAIVHEPQREEITPEGELAVVAGARCVSRGRELECTVAIIGAEPALCIEALGEPGRARAHALSLIGELGLGLGETRHRWFRYETPARWFGVRRSGGTAWLHPDHPRVPAIAHVFDARPTVADDADRFDNYVLRAMGDDFEARGESVVTDLEPAFGLEGRLRVAHGTRRGHEVVRIAVACSDDRFSYFAHFEGTNDPEIIETVGRMFASFRPLPRARTKLDAFGMWDA